MSSKKIYCYKFDILKNGKCSNETKSIVNMMDRIFNDPNQKVTMFKNGNKALKFDNDEEENYLSLESLKEIGNVKIDKKYMFFRIGRQKDIEGALKRDKVTFLGAEVFDKIEQKRYELEICTYILIDIEKGIVFELFGQFAPSINGFSKIINSYLDKNILSDRINIRFNNIMTDKMVETYKNNGISLNEIGYTYNIPNVGALRELGLDSKQIDELKELNVYEVKVSIRNRPRVPLTRNVDRIKYTVGAFAECVKDIKDTIKFKGSTASSGTQEYNFDKSKVTYTLDVSNYRRQDSLEIKLTLDEFAEQIYTKMKDTYENNRSDIEKYILEE